MPESGKGRDRFASRSPVPMLTRSIGSFTLTTELPAGRSGLRSWCRRRSPDRYVASRHLESVQAPLLRSYVLRLTQGDIDKAEDVVQETLWRARLTPEARDDSGRWTLLWLFTMAHIIFIGRVGETAARPVAPPSDITGGTGPGGGLEGTSRGLDGGATRGSSPDRLVPGATAAAGLTVVRGLTRCSFVVRFLRAKLLGRR